MMRRNLIIGLGVAMLCAVVFALTLIKQYAPPGSLDGASGTTDGESSVPLSFTSNQLYYSPGDESITRRYFEGFYEPSSSALVAAPFWFQNPHAEPVTVTVRGRSCTACTSARMATISAERLSKLQAAVAADVALSANSFAGLNSALAAADLMTNLDWQQLDFEQPDRGAVVPAAVSPDRPTWGILQLEIKVGAVGPADRSVLVGTQLGNGPVVEQAFRIGLAGAAPFTVDQNVVTLGDLPEGTGPRSTYVSAWSATRDLDSFPPPAVAVNTKDGFVQVGTPIPLTPAELLELEAQFRAIKQPSRVRSGYRLPITVYRTRPTTVPGEGPAEPEIGPFERTVQVAGPNQSTASFKITGTVTGVVTLQGATAVDLKDFNGKHGTTETFHLISDRPGVTIALDPATTPSFLKVKLGEPTPFGPTRKRWELTVSVPPEACYGDFPRDSAVVLSGKLSGEAFRVRLPAKGKGYRRGL